MTRLSPQRLPHPGPRGGTPVSSSSAGPRHGNGPPHCDAAVTKGGSIVPTEPLPSAIVELGRLVERRMHRALSEHGVTAGQFMALMHIGGRPGISRADLARGLQLSPQAAGGLTTQLLDMALVARTEAAGPGLAVEFFATDAGLRLLSDSAETLESITEEILQCFRPNLAAAMDGGVRHLLARLS